MIFYSANPDSLRITDHTIVIRSECIQTRYFHGGNNHFLGLNQWSLISMDPGLSFVDAPHYQEKPNGEVNSN